MEAGVKHHSAWSIAKAQSFITTMITIIQPALKFGMASVQVAQRFFK